MQRIDNLPNYPLPLAAHFTHPSRDVVNAYELCYSAEGVVDPIRSRWHSDETVMEKLVNIRVLAYLLSQSGLLSEIAISKIAKDVISCRKEPIANDETRAEALVKLGAFYRDVLLRPFHKRKSQTPDVSPCSNTSSPSSKSDESSSSSDIRALAPSWASFELAEDEVDKMLSETPKSYFTARKLAKHRQDQRCIVSRILDLPFAEGLHIRTGQFYAGDVSCLRLCIIFPELVNVDTASERTTDEHNPSPHTQQDALKSLGYTDMVDRLGGSDGVYSLENVMMVTVDLRARFDVLSLWLEPVDDVPNRYRLCSPWIPPNGLQAGQEITFQSADPRLALPNREYLAVHAACCRVAHLSGAFGVLNRLGEDMEYLV